MIPLSVPNLNGNELKYVSECISSGWISSAGDFVGRFESEFAGWLGRMTRFPLLMELLRCISIAVAGSGC